MADAAALTARFAPADTPLPEPVLAELESICRLHNIDASELFFKWESYAMKMGADDTRLDLKTVRDFKKDLRDALERETRSKQSHAKPGDRRAAAATPRGRMGADMLGGMMDGVSPGTPRVPMAGVNGNSAKRRSNFDTPGAKAIKAQAGASPHDSPMASVPFSERANAGQVVETLNDGIALPEGPAATESRIKLKANTDLTKFAYKPMAMKLSDASEILDDRIEAFLELVQDYHHLDDGAFGNPASQSTNEIVAVGRIASDAGEGKLNASSVVLETSRRTGGGMRVPLRLDALDTYDLFPGKIVAVRGTNPAGETFAVAELLALPPQGPNTAAIDDVHAAAARIGQPDALTVIVAAGPYTADSNLDYEPLHALCEAAATSNADAVILLGPFLDIEHPLLAAGDFADLPALANLERPDAATLTDVFRALVAGPLTHLAARLPHAQLILVPSVRDAMHKHVSFPQDRARRVDWGLPKSAVVLTNSVVLGLNETMVALSSADVLGALRADATSKGQGAGGLVERLGRSVIEQRHFYPVFPPPARAGLARPAANLHDTDSALASGPNLDVSYLALADWPAVKPDVFITSSAMTPPFAKVVESVVVVNPGPLSKRRAAGTYTRVTLVARHVDETEAAAGDGHVLVKAWERARVDIMRI